MSASNEGSDDELIGDRTATVVQEAASASDSTGTRQPLGLLLPPVIGHPADFTASELYQNRELSWLDFNDRVFEEARDARNPLLERIHFLAFSSSNLDEFYQTRVAWLQRTVAIHPARHTVDGMTFAEQLWVVRARCANSRRVMARYCRGVLQPALLAQGVHILACDEVDDATSGKLDAYFMSHLYPALASFVTDTDDPFQHSDQQKLFLLVGVHDPLRGSDGFATAMPGMRVSRSADANEVVEAWPTAMRSRDRPAMLLLTRQAVPTIDRARYAGAEGVARGADVVADAAGRSPDVLLLATGSEVSICGAAYEALAAEGRRARGEHAVLGGLPEPGRGVSRSGASGYGHRPGGRRGSGDVRLGTLRRHDRRHPRDALVQSLGADCRRAATLRLRTSHVIEAARAQRALVQQRSHVS